MSRQEPDPLVPDVRHAATALRQRLGPSPTLEELAAYQAGELSDTAAERIRDHLSLSPSSVRMVLDLDQFWSDEPPAGGEPLSDAEVRADWESLRRRLYDEGVLASAPEVSADSEESPSAYALPAELPASSPLPANVVRGRFGLGAPRWLQGLAAALLLLSCGLALWNLELRSDLARFGSAVWLDLPREGTRSVGEWQPLEASTQPFVLEVSRYVDATGFESLRVEIFEIPGEARIYAQDAPRTRNELLLIPGGLLRPEGRYRLVVSGLGGDAPQVLREVGLQVEP